MVMSVYGTLCFGYGAIIPSKSVAIGIAADVNPPPVPVGCAVDDPKWPFAEELGCERHWPQLNRIDPIAP